MEEVIDPEEGAKRTHRRMWWIISSLLLLTVAIIGYLMFIYDVAPPDDALLLPKPFPPASGPHSIPEFVRRVGKLIEAEKEERQKLSEDVRRVTPDEVSKARAFVDKHHAILDELDRFLQANRGNLPFPGGSDGMNMSADCGYLSDFQEIANLAAMKARVLAQEGKGRESIEQSLVLMRLGKQLAGDGNFLIQWLVAITIQAIGVFALENAAIHHPWDAQDLVLVEKGLSDSEIPLKNFQFALQGEYLSFKRAIRQTELENRASPLSFSRPEEWWKHTLKPNLTYTQKLNEMKLLYDACDKDWRACFLAGQANERAYKEYRQHEVRRYLNVNIAGNLLASGGVYEGICERTVRTAAYHRLAVIMMALRRFELEQGTLPGKLEELCPKYLPTVPLDPYDNQSMRWNPATKALYSVGKDLKDDGGSFSKPGFPTKDDKDVGMSYWWKPEDTKTTPAAPAIPAPMRRSP